MVPVDTPPPVHDVFGREIREGDKIVYARRKGSTASLNRGVVVTAEHYDDGFMMQGKGIRIPRWKPRIRVEAEELWINGWRPLSRVVTLTIPNRIVVVDSDAW